MWVWGPDSPVTTRLAVWPQRRAVEHGGCRIKNRVLVESEASPVEFPYGSAQLGGWRYTPSGAAAPTIVQRFHHAGEKPRLPALGNHRGIIDLNTQ